MGVFGGSERQQPQRITHINTNGPVEPSGPAFLPACPGGSTNAFRGGILNPLARRLKPKVFRVLGGIRAVPAMKLSYDGILMIASHYFGSCFLLLCAILSYVGRLIATRRIGIMPACFKTSLFLTPCFTTVGCSVMGQLFSVGKIAGDRNVK